MLINTRFMLIVLLSLWLPLQSLAGVLVHCERLTDPVTIAGAVFESSELLTPVTNIASQTADPKDCHGTPALPSTSSMDKSDQSGPANCFHCDDSCHGTKNLSMPTAHLLIGTTATGSFQQLHQAAADGYAVSPQRPPCKFLLA